MSQAPVSLATFAPPLPAPVAPTGPALPAAPAHLDQGATALAPLRGAVSTLPYRYLMAGIIPLAIAVVAMLLGLIISWPASY